MKSIGLKVMILITILAPFDGTAMFRVTCEKINKEIVHRLAGGWCRTLSFECAALAEIQKDDELCT